MCFNCVFVVVLSDIRVGLFVLASRNFKIFFFQLVRSDRMREVPKLLNFCDVGVGKKMKNENQPVGKKVLVFVR